MRCVQEGRNYASGWATPPEAPQQGNVRISTHSLPAKMRSIARTSDRHHWKHVSSGRRQPALDPPSAHGRPDSTLGAATWHGLCHRCRPGLHAGIRRDHCGHAPSDMAEPPNVVRHKDRVSLWPSTLSNQWATRNSAVLRIVFTVQLRHRATNIPPRFVPLPQVFHVSIGPMPNVQTVHAHHVLPLF